MTRNDIIIQLHFTYLTMIYFMNIYCIANILCKIPKIIVSNKFFHCVIILFNYLISGRCLFLNQEFKIVDLFRCHTFANGCPNLENFVQKFDECMYSFIFIDIGYFFVWFMRKIYFFIIIFIKSKQVNSSCTNICSFNSTVFFDNR